MRSLHDWTLLSRENNGLTLQVEGGFVLRLQALEDHLIRLSLRPKDGYRLDRTWSIAPDHDVPFQGRQRDSETGFSCPEVFHNDTGFETGTLKVQITAPLCLTWSSRAAPDAPWKVFASDRPLSAYMTGTGDRRVAHHMRLQDGDRIFGLGEKSGPLERTGRRFEMRNLDAMGYDAERTDPLYKHLPVTFTQTNTAGAFGLFYDNLANCWFDLGNELDNYHPRFRSWRAEDGDLDLYLSWGPQLLDVIKAHHRLIGGMQFGPLWGLGYSGSSMNLADADDAQTRTEGFLADCAAHDIPVDSFQMSSGYTRIGPRRYVFNWDHDRFPSPQTMAAHFAAEDTHLIANIKPALLDSHPRYDEARDLGLFVGQAGGAPETSVYWDGMCSHLDMTNPGTIDWWQGNVTTQLLNKGITATWNDNNEYQVEDETARCAGFGQPIDIGLIRPLHGMLMTRASFDAQKAHAPRQRPYLISRSAAPGTQRYAQSWTGDNRTSWHSLRWNIPMGVGLSMSGFYNIGHDIGGFAGPAPDPELLLRWVQNGIFHPRFTIHSWNDDGSTNTPWMHPKVLPQIRNAIALRYRLMPYLYSCLYQAAHHDEPLLRPIFLDHPDDPTCFEPTFDFMCGRGLLIASVLEPGARSRRVYLPDCDQGWWDFHSQQPYQGGQWVEVPVDLTSVPVFVKGGTALPLSAGPHRRIADTMDGLQLLVFPQLKDGQNDSLLYQDDGHAADAVPNAHRLTRFTVRRAGDAVDVTAHQTGPYTPPTDQPIVLCASGFTGRFTPPLR